ncbi:MAG: 50S ribosomal protein L1, partial [Halobacteriota archaeon]
MVNENTIRVVNDAIESAPKRKFTESVDLVVNLKNIDLSQPKNRITDSIV